MLNKKEKYQVYMLLLKGLHVDGAHHKQYYLEEVLKRIIGGEEVKKLKSSLNSNWAEGIA